MNAARTQPNSPSSSPPTSHSLSLSPSSSIPYLIRFLIYQRKRGIERNRFYNYWILFLYLHPRKYAFVEYCHYCYCLLKQQHQALAITTTTTSAIINQLMPSHCIQSIHIYIYSSKCLPILRVQLLCWAERHIERNTKNATNKSILVCVCVCERAYANKREYHQRHEQ